MFFVVKVVSSPNDSRQDVGRLNDYRRGGTLPFEAPFLKMENIEILKTCFD